MRAYELLESTGIERSDPLPLPKWSIIVPGGSYDTYQISKMFANPYMAHTAKYEYKNAGDFEPGHNTNQTIFTFADDITYNRAKKVLKHFGVEFVCGDDVILRSEQKPYTDDLMNSGDKR